MKILMRRLAEVGKNEKGTKSKDRIYKFKMWGMWHMFLHGSAFEY